MSVKNSNDTTRNRTRDLPARSAGLSQLRHRVSSWSFDKSINLTSSSKCSADHSLFSDAATAVQRLRRPTYTVLATLCLFIRISSTSLFVTKYSICALLLQSSRERAAQSRGTPADKSLSYTFKVKSPPKGGPSAAHARTHTRFPFPTRVPFLIQTESKSW